MDEERQLSGPLRVGMVWGGIGGVVGFAASLIVPYLGGLLAAVLVGAACGRRAAGSGGENPSRAGSVSGALAAPVFALGAAAGTLLATRQVGMEQLASTASEATGVGVTGQEAWEILLGATAVVALLQMAALILTAVLFANRASGKDGDS